VRLVGLQIGFEGAEHLVRKALGGHAEQQVAHRERAPAQAEDRQLSLAGVGQDLLHLREEPNLRVGQVLHGGTGDHDGVQRPGVGERDVGAIDPRRVVEPVPPAASPDPHGFDGVGGRELRHQHVRELGGVRHEVDDSDPHRPGRPAVAGRPGRAQVE
jgi:hypothetical protein